MTRSFTYDAENRQVSATINTSTSSYAYDGLGLRVMKTAGGATTVYVCDAFGDLAAEYSSQTPASPCGTQACYLATDHLGSTRLLIDSTGSNVQRYDYLPFGEELLASTNGRTTAMGYFSAADLMNPKFTGKNRDGETFLDWYEVRFMSGAQGRFQSVDPGNAGASPVDPQTWNMYAYVANNPLSYTDPSGMGFWSDLFGAVETGLTFAGKISLSVVAGAFGGPAAGAAVGGVLFDCGGPLGWCGGGSGAAPWNENPGLGNVQDPGRFIMSFGDQPALDLPSLPGLDFLAFFAPIPRACNDQNAVGFVKAHAGDAAQVAGQLQVPTENVLGLSAAESGYGTGAFAINGRNNFFSLHGDASAPFANGSVKSARDGLMSTFPSYKASAQSFAAQYGSLVKGKSNPTQFVTALVPRFNSAKAATGGDPRFVPNTVSVIQMVKARLGCK